MADSDSTGRRIGAAVISLIVPGAGHIYRGRLRRGVAWFGALALLFFTMPWTGPIALGAALLARFAVPVDAALCRPGPPLPNRTQLEAGVAMLVGMVALTMLLRAVVIEAFKIPSASMTPTLKIGDFIYVNKLARPSVGDVAVFRHPQTPRDFVARVVGVGGDRIAVRAGVLYRNGEKVPRGPGTTCPWEDRDEASGEWSRTEGRCEEETLGGHRFTVMLDPDRETAYGYHDFPPLDGDRPPRFYTDPRSPVPAPPLEVVDGAYVVPAGHLFVMGDSRDNSNDSRSWGPVPAGNVKGVVMYVWWSRGPDGVRWGRLGHAIE